MARQDILVNENRDPIISNGDFTVGVSDEQHVADIIEGVQGYWREHPLIGLDLLRFHNAPYSQGRDNLLRREIKVALNLDGYKLSKYNSSTGEVKYQNDYE